jgi:hypothetical protein
MSRKETTQRMTRMTRTRTTDVVTDSVTRTGTIRINDMARRGRTTRTTGVDDDKIR